MELTSDPENKAEGAEEACGEAEEETEEATEEEAEAAPKAEATQSQPADQAAAPRAEATPEPAKPKGEELKVVILVNGDSVMLGVVKPDCDPVFKNLTGDLAAALQQVPAFVGEARQKWAVSPRYPKAPEPPPTVTTAAAPARTPAPAKPKAQPSFF